MTRKFPQVATRAGAYEGAWIEARNENESPVAVFRGIHYAAPPTGFLRWAAPEPPDPFDGVRPATEPGPACPQPPGWDAPYRAAARLAGIDPRVVEMKAGPTDEDCLRLDIWTPALGRDARIPVMVWIHGGASVFGTGSAPLFDGSRLAAEHGVIVVSITYRLGVLGFLGHEARAAESVAGTAGNYGFLDQVAALVWVHRNISGFGGDPDCVTVFGESAGGRAVFELLAHPDAQGLFQRAIAQSPWEETQHCRHLRIAANGLESAYDLGYRLQEELGIGAKDRQTLLKEMLQAPADEIVSAANRVGFAPSTWGPVVDGVVFPDHPLALLARGENAAVPLLLGFNSHEGSIFFLDDLPFPTADSYRSYVEKTHPEAASELLELYPPSDDPRELHASFSGLYGDRTFTFPGLLAAKALAPRTDVYLYRFTHVHSPFSDDALHDKERIVGAYHAAEIPLIFGTLAGGPLDEHDEPLGRAMRTYWTNFAKTGNPNGDRSDANDATDRNQLPTWPRFKTGEEAYLELGDTPRPAARPLADRFPAFARALASRFSLNPSDLSDL